MCHDFAPIDSLANMQSSFLNLGEYSDTSSYEEESVIFDLCDTIVTEEAQNDFNTLNSHTIPTLVMAGEFDPVTPSSLSQEVYNTLNNAYFFSLDHHGHGVTTDGCGKEIMRQFIENPEISPTNSCSTLPTSFKVASARTPQRTPDMLDSRIKSVIREKGPRIKEYLPKR